MTIPILEQIQRMDRGTGAGELRGDIRYWLASKAVRPNYVLCTVYEV